MERTRDRDYYCTTCEITGHDKYDCDTHYYSSIWLKLYNKYITNNSYVYYINDSPVRIITELKRTDSECNHITYDSDDGSNSDDDDDYCKGRETGADSIHAHTDKCNYARGFY